ncbi:MAG: transglycosylase SLT domain-containing protein, partial [Thermodesulfobacteriota bacterium]|nr:transglycosylase SLT domain-containing protein [Thermodesulfobacteriota bacterium]
MLRYLRFVWLFSVIFILLASRSLAADPWGKLQDKFNSANKQTVPTVSTAKLSEAKPLPTLTDPWAQLQTIYLPFSVEDEEIAQVDPVVGKKLAAQFHKSLEPYRQLIIEASTRFNVPVEVIAAVIMVESAGNSQAAANTSSAKGLMQTIDATFAAARKALHNQGVYIPNNPFDPHASIMAGTWYLDQMFKQVVHDRGPVLNRNSITSWRLPSEYYYAGPGHGRKRNQIVIIYAGG